MLHAWGDEADPNKSNAFGVRLICSASNCISKSFRLSISLWLIGNNELVLYVSNTPTREGWGEGTMLLFLFPSLSFHYCTEQKKPVILEFCSVEGKSYIYWNHAVWSVVNSMFWWVTLVFQFKQCAEAESLALLPHHLLFSFVKKGWHSSYERHGSEYQTQHA